MAKRDLAQVGLPRVGTVLADQVIEVGQNGQTRVYLVRETKSKLDIDEIGWSEAMRIRFAEKHFEAAPDGDVDFNHTNDTDPNWAKVKAKKP